MVRKVVILSGNHLCHNPRVIKEADSLAQAGFDVEVLGAWLDAGLAQRDRELALRQQFRYTPVMSLVDGAGRNSLEGTLFRAERWLGMKSMATFGLQTASALGYGLRALLAAARERKADLYIAHSEPALWVLRRLHRLGRRIGVDMEDWFSRDLMPEAHRSRPLALLRALEAYALKASVHATCTSESMSIALAQAYGVDRPNVIYNAFPWSERDAIDERFKDRRDGSAVSVHWFSQSIGPGRGLEDLFASLPMLRGNIEVHIRGSISPAYRSWLEDVVPSAWRRRVHVHGIVPNDELLSRIGEHDIGLSLEPAVPPNKDLTVSNKILQYALAGLAIVASETAGHREIAPRMANGIRLYGQGQVGSLASTLNDLVSRPAELAQAKAAALGAAKDIFSWEKMAPRLVASVERAMASAGTD